MGFNFVIVLEFLLFNLIWIQIPGMMLDAILLRKRRFWATKLLSGYVLGLVLMTLLYFVQGVIGFKLLLTLAGPIFTVVSVGFWFFHKKATLFSNGKKPRLEQIPVFLIILLMSILAFQVKWSKAPGYDLIQINHDVLYHVGNIVTLSRGVPAVDLRVSGVDFYYHYIYDLVYGMCKNVFHMDAYSLYVSGMPLLGAWTLGLALIMLGDRCFEKRKHTDLENVAGRKVRFDYKYMFYIIGIFFCGVCIYPINILAEYFPLSWLNYHLFTNINSIGFAVVGAILFVDVVVDNWKDDFCFRTLLVLFAYEYFATAAKGPSGVMLLFSVFAVAFVQAIIEKKITWVRFGFFIATLIGFIFSYVMIVAGLAGTGGNNREIEISPSGTIMLSRMGNIFNKYLGINPYELSVMWLVLILIAICLIGPSLLSVLGWVGIKFSRLRKENYIGDIYDWFCICLTMVGIGGCLCVSIIGFSQGYMVLTAAPFIYYMIMRYLQRGKSKFLKNIQIVAFALGVFMVLADGVFFGIENTKQEGYTYETTDKAWVVPGELEGYLWIRDNTDENALICTDRRTEGIDTRNTFFYLSALGERNVYLEGHSYSDVTDDVIEKMVDTNRKFYSSENEVARKALIDNKIDYMVVSNFTHSMYEATCEVLNLVYSNDDVRIYEVKNGGVDISVYK